MASSPQQHHSLRLRIVLALSLGFELSRLFCHTTHKETPAQAALLTRAVFVVVV